MRRSRENNGKKPFYQLFIQSAINSFWTMINLLQKPSDCKFPHPIYSTKLDNYLNFFGGHLQTR